MKVIENWRDMWKWHSVHILVLIGLLPQVWASLPADAKGYIPPEWQPWIVTALAVAGLVGRIRPQE